MRLVDADELLQQAKKYPHPDGAEYAIPISAVENATEYMAETCGAFAIATPVKRECENCGRIIERGKLCGACGGV